MGEPDPKPRPRIRLRPGTLDHERCYAKVHHPGSRCRICGEPYPQAHHLVPRSRGGDDVPENLIPLCELHHSAFERGLNRRELASRIRAVLEPAEVAYIEERAGAAFLDGYYPVRP